MSDPRPKQGVPRKRGRDWTVPREKVSAEGCCRACQTVGVLDAAHIIPRSLGGTETADATVPLCRECHTLYDSGRLDLLPLLSLGEQSYAAGLVGIARAYRIITNER